MRKGCLYALISGSLAVAFTVYMVLDTFVISHAYATAATSTSTQSSSLASNQTTEEGSDTATDVVITDTSYSDSNMDITISTYRENDTDIYVADIVLTSASYLKTALAQATYGKNITDTTSDIAESVDAILAINGDYYGVQEYGYVIRNGVLYRSEGKSDQEDLVIYEDGSLEVINEDDITAEELLEKGAYNVLSFGPGLIENGSISVSETDEVDKAMTSNPRTAIGIIDDLHYVFVVSDGRTSESEGLTLYQMAEFMETLGVETAYNLDGGGSSTMVFNGTVINNPSGGNSKKHSKNSSSTNSSERSVSDIVYIGY